MASIEIRQALKQSTKKGFTLRKEPLVSTHAMLSKKTAVEKPIAAPATEKPAEMSAIDIGPKGSGPQQPSVRRLKVHKEE